MSASYIPEIIDSSTGEPINPQYVILNVHVTAQPMIQPSPSVNQLLLPGNRIRGPTTQLVPVSPSKQLLLPGNIAKYPTAIPVTWPVITNRSQSVDLNGYNY